MANQSDQHLRGTAKQKTNICEKSTLRQAAVIASSCLASLTNLLCEGGVKLFLAALSSWTTFAAIGSTQSRWKIDVELPLEHSGQTTLVVASVDDFLDVVQPASGLPIG